MTAPDDPRLSPAEEAAVRAHLAEARHTDPVPDQVVARLDAVLDDLVAERPAADADAGSQPEPALAPVVPLASRRRRALTTGLVAAAAVVALGVALPQVLETTGSDGGASESASSADRGAGAGSAAEAPSEDRDLGAEDQGSATDRLSPSPGAAEGQGSAFAAPLVLSSSAPLRPAVRQLVRDGAVPLYAPSPRCRIDVGEGQRVDATWDGMPALVVLRDAQDGRREVEVFLCGSAQVVGSTSLRAP